MDQLNSNVGYILCILCCIAKVFPLQAMKAQRDVDARVHIYTATALGRVLGWLVLRLAAFTPWESPDTHFIGG